MPNQSVFMQRLEMVLDSRGMKQSDLCRATHLRSSNFTAWKSGSSPSLENALLIARALKVSLDWLSGLTDEVSPGLKSEDERELMAHYRSTDVRGKTAIMAVAESQAGDMGLVRGKRKRTA